MKFFFTKVLLGGYLFFWGISVLTDIPRTQELIGKGLMLAGGALVIWAIIGSEDEHKSE